ncbi:hypothetical protein BCR34DRAFT_581868 [Clohesyomyces aquaticus]|uniref:TMEM205-like domain-containing protein n=1 Tax=Clohesyomyces aquaticus TaxID=1231657 RepID=A0A1Y1XU54_9PLEO|nr:hypothetical protein BCR34DRAFT_581868 [Clohesyomyces aquaticus]
MTSLSTFTNPATYHILSYGTLLGSTLFQSFISGIIAFRVLPRPQFSTLQKHTFPVYFMLQSGLPTLLFLTYPSGALTLLPSSLTPSSSTLSTASSITTLAQDKLAFTLIGSMFVTGLVNMLYIGPQTTKTMELRKHQETRDGKKSYDKGPHSKEMQALNHKFGVLHGASSVLNLGGLIAMIWYGGLLGEVGYKR